MNNNIEYLYLFGPGVGLTALDVGLLLFCPIAAALGTTVSTMIRLVNAQPEFEELKELPASYRKERGSSLSEEQELALLNEERRKDYAVAMWKRDRGQLPRLTFIGLVLGFVVALYFVGAITQSATSLARILALCVLLGYQAPTLWSLQARVVEEAANKKLQDLLGSKKES